MSIKKILVALAVCFAMICLFSYGYFLRGQQESFVTKVIEKSLRKLDEIRGLPLPKERALERIETTFIRFKGSLYPLPNTDYVNGGAMTVWADDLLVMPKTGIVHRFVDGTGLVKTSILPPTNGLDDYITLSQTPEYANYLHKPRSVRFNDILYVDRKSFRGLIISYTFFDLENTCYGSRLARVELSSDVTSVENAQIAPDDWTVFFETTPCLALNPDWTALDGIMAGGRMALADDERIIFGSGEYHLDGIHTYDVGIMDPETSYGKVLSINYLNGDAEIMAMGHRNVQGVAIDAEGEIWTVEHAIRGGDELNHILQGENHGWPEESLGTLYSGQPLPLSGVEGRHDVYDPPAFAWLPSSGTSALTAIDNFHPAWDGDLLAGSLSNADFGQSLFHIRTQGEHVVFVERIRLGRRVRYVTQFQDKIAVWLDPTDLLILEQEDRVDPLNNLIAQMSEEFSPQIVEQTTNQLLACSQCHSFEQFNHASAPSLNGVGGRGIASTDYSGYSEALQAVPGRWTTAALRAYLVDPDSFAPGTVMPSAGLEEGAQLDALIWALEQIDTNEDPHIRYN